MYELLAQAVIAAIPSIMKMVEGDKQGKAAKDILNNNQRPVKTVPKELLNSLTLANYRANSTTMPGGKTTANRLGSSYARGVNSLADTQNDPASIAAGIAALNQSNNKSIENLGVAGANYQDQAEQTLMGVNTQVGASRDQAWDWNERNKYLSAMASASALTNASGQNKYSATQDLSTLGVGLIGGLSAQNKQQQPAANMGSPAWNQASTTPPQNYPYQNAFPTAQEGSQNFISPQTAQTNVNSSAENMERKQRMLSIYGSEENIPAEFKIFYQ